MFPVVAKPLTVLYGDALHTYYAHLSEYHSAFGELPVFEKIDVWKDPSHPKIRLVSENIQQLKYGVPLEELTHVWKKGSEEEKTIQLMKYICEGNKN